MGKMKKRGREDIIRVLREDNPLAKEQDIAVYADAFIAYEEASANIQEHGNIVAHPRTGAPLENPYIKVLSSSTTRMRAIRMKTDRLWV